MAAQVRSGLALLATGLVIVVALVVLHRMVFVLKGDPAATVAIIAFSDFQCPYCRVFAQDTWPALQKEYIDTGQVRFAFRHLPLDSIHLQARRIAEAAECASRHSSFREIDMFDRLRIEELVLVPTAWYGRAWPGPTRIAHQNA